MSLFSWKSSLVPSQDWGICMAQWQVHFTLRRMKSDLTCSGLEGNSLSQKKDKWVNQIAGTIVLTFPSNIRDQAKQRDLLANTFYSSWYLDWNAAKLLFPAKRLFQEKTQTKSTKKTPKKTTTTTLILSAWLSYSVLLIQSLWIGSLFAVLLSSVTSLTQDRLNWQKWTQILMVQHSCQSHSIDIDSFLSLFHELLK